MYTIPSDDTPLYFYSATAPTGVTQSGTQWMSSSKISSSGTVSIYLLTAKTQYFYKSSALNSSTTKPLYVGSTTSSATATYGQNVWYNKWFDTSKTDGSINWSTSNTLYSAISSNTTSSSAGDNRYSRWVIKRWMAPTSGKRIKTLNLKLSARSYSTNYTSTNWTKPKICAAVYDFDPTENNVPVITGKGCPAGYLGTGASSVIQTTSFSTFNISIELNKNFTTAGYLYVYLWTVYYNDIATGSYPTEATLRDTATYNAAYINLTQYGGSGNCPTLTITAEDTPLIEHHYIKYNKNGSYVNAIVWVNVNGVWKEGTPWVNVNGAWKSS